MYVTSPSHFMDAHPVNAGHLLNKDTGACSHTRKIHAGHLLFCEGDRAAYVYEILEGVVRSSKVLSDGRRQVMSFGYPGDIIGISHDCSYHSDCEAISDVQVRIHRKNACSVTAAKEPEFCSLLMKHAAAEMSNMQEHFLMLGRKSAAEKVASFLAVLSDRVGENCEDGLEFDLPMSRSDIADFLGLTIETVSRTLTRFRKDGVIGLPNPHRVCVFKIGALRALAERDD